MDTTLPHSELFGKSMAFPPRVGEDGRVAWSEGPQNIHESIQIILMTEIEERLMLPEFGGGLSSFLYEPNTTETHRQIEEQIRQALERWEPRVQLESVVVDEDPGNAEAAVATIRYRLVATGQNETLDLTVPLSS
ncbi:MAG: GPW/gp25 family protein [Verrucomicrobiota bacterium]